ncbi:OmpH family outer membrane protein [Moraxella sp. ZY210820]|uniref:OmpH family outer membrane protein n=1 Tax=unclassified Moraxella TaxID=2685852 RepID=UPI00272FE85D|nr:OmpH family outer membrane protein [Moraxella sp. ZY210820]WLF84938.1 OmpH family outer membrane protein [Moraxella sp. ZY210820]
MKKIALLVAGMTMSVASFANQYAVVDLPKVIESSTYVKQQEASLQQSIKADTTKLEQLRKELAAMQQKAQTEAPKMKEDELKRLEQQFETKMNEFGKLQQQVQTRVQQGMGQIENTLNNRISQVTEQLRVENKFDIVLERGVVLSYDKKVDITDKVIQRLNAIK